MLEKILPANGTKTVGELFYEVLEGIGKLQNFAVYMEGSRVPLDFNVDTSVLVGQKVLIKYLPGPCKFNSESRSLSIPSVNLIVIVFNGNKVCGCVHLDRKAL